MKSYLAQVPHSASIIGRVEVNLLTFLSFASGRDAWLHIPASLPVQQDFYLLDKCVVSQGRASSHRTVSIPEWWEVVEMWAHSLCGVTKAVKMVM